MRDPLAQPDETLRALNLEEPRNGERSEVFCTKVGTTNPDEMYIIGAHMDGHGFGEAANDDGSGTAIVMELARIFSAPDVQTGRSIRFVLWNNEETGSSTAVPRMWTSGANGRGLKIRRAPVVTPSLDGWA